MSDVPVAFAVLVPQVQVMAETAETPQLLLVAQFPRVQVVEEAVEIPQLQVVKKTGVTPETFEIPQLQVVEKIGENPEWLNFCERCCGLGGFSRLYPERDSAAEQDFAYRQEDACEESSPDACRD